MDIHSHLCQKNGIGNGWKNWEEGKRASDPQPGLVLKEQPTAKPLENLVAMSRENIILVQKSVSASGLPWASPRVADGAKRARGVLGRLRNVDRR